jgi:hypothetical protein
MPFLWPSYVNFIEFRHLKLPGFKAFSSNGRQFRIGGRAGILRIKANGKISEPRPSGSGQVGGI